MANQKTPWVWSTTAADNATADSTIGFAEGQTRKSLNDSCRALMAAFKAWLKDTGDGITTAGTSTAYTATSLQTIDTLVDGIELKLIPHTTCGVTPTLNLNSIGATTIKTLAGDDIAAGMIRSGEEIVVRYKATGTTWRVVRGLTVAKRVFPTVQARSSTASFTLDAEDRVVYQTASLPANRTWTLPAASSVPPGTVLRLGDMAATIAEGNVINVSPGGSDTIDGAAAGVVQLPGPYSKLDLMSDGTDKWLILSSGTKVTQFTSSGTFTKDPRARAVRVIATGSGGGGGGGYGALGVAPGESYCGGGGGGGAQRVDITLPVADFTSPVTVTIASGGGGGAGGTGGTAGANGSAGGSTTFGTYVTAYGGGRGGRAVLSEGGAGGGGGGDGVGGNGTNGTAGTAAAMGGAAGGDTAAGGVPTALGFGSGGGGCGNNGAANTGGRPAIGGCGGGGSGGGYSNGGAVNNGAAGYSMLGTSSTGGTGNSGSPGGAASTTAIVSSMFPGGGGAGGGGSNGNGGAGSAGQIPGGGGGGGGGGVGTGGAGGAGGRGEIIVIEYFG